MKTLTTLIILSLAFNCKAQFTGCAANNFSAAPSSQFMLFTGSGNYQLDQFLSTEANVLRSFFSVNPSFFLYDDTGSPNARAFPVAQLPQYPDGTVVLGKTYFNMMYNFAQNVTVVPVTMAHEYGHIVDYKYHVIQANGMYAELFADFMAGAFLYYRSVLTPTDVYNNLNWFYSIGDYAGVNDPGHHGTPQQRLAAAMAGYNWLKTNAYPGINVTQAIPAAKAFLGIP